MLPPEYIEVSERHYRENAAAFSAAGFTEAIAAKLWPRMLVAGPWDAFHLFLAAREIPDGGAYCELGGAWGGSLLCVYESVRSAGNRCSLTCIEQTVESELREVATMTGAQLIEGCSWEVFDEVNSPLDLLVIDASHTYESVRKDIGCYVPKVRDGGVILCHDFDWWDGSRGGENHLGVVQAVMESFGAKEVIKPKFSAWAKVMI